MSIAPELDNRVTVNVQTTSYNGGDFKLCIISGHGTLRAQYTLTLNQMRALRTAVDAAIKTLINEEQVKE